MKLRFLTTYDEFGMDSPTYLQYFDEKLKKWKNVDHIRMSEKEAEED